MEDHRIEGDQMRKEDKERVNGILNRIVKDGRIRYAGNDQTAFVKQ